MKHKIGNKYLCLRGGLFAEKDETYTLISDDYMGLEMRSDGNISNPHSVYIREIDEFWEEVAEEERQQASIAKAVPEFSFGQGPSTKKSVYLTTDGVDPTIPVMGKNKWDDLPKEDIDFEELSNKWYSGFYERK